jgi:predicted DNA-binding transcriptional regulator AlpA
VKTGKLIPLSVLAKAWGWSVWRLYHKVQQQEIPHLRIGARRDVFFEEDAVERWLEAQRVREKTSATPAPRPRSGAREIEEELAALGVERDPAFL